MHLRHIYLTPCRAEHGGSNKLIQAIGSLTNPHPAVPVLALYTFLCLVTHEHVSLSLSRTLSHTEVSKFTVPCCTIPYPYLSCGAMANAEPGVRYEIEERDEAGNVVATYISDEGGQRVDVIVRQHVV